MEYLIIAVCLLILILHACLRAKDYGRKKRGEKTGVERHKEEEQLKLENLKKSLESALPPDETIVAFLNGHLSTLVMSEQSVDLRFATLSDPKQKSVHHGTGMLAATDKRLIMYQNAKKGENLRTFGYDTISGVQTKRNFAGGTAVTITADEPIEIGYLFKEDDAINRFTEYVRERQAEAAQPSPSELVPPSSSGQAPDIASQIQSLAELKDKGVLTEDEFNAKKQDLLDRM